MERKFILSCCSTVDLPYSYMEQRDIPVLFYTYTGALGIHIVWADILVFFLAALAAFALDFHLLQKGRFTSLWQQLLGLLVLWGLAFLFVYFTFRPPMLALWQDPVTGVYGIP